MNFEIKSTFKIHNSTFEKTKSFLLKRKKQFYGNLILSFNTIGSLTAGILYLNNYIIPATIGSRPHGLLYIHLLELTGWLVITSSCLGLTLSLSHRLPETCIDIPVSVFKRVREAGIHTKKQLINLYLVINLLKPFRQSQERALLKLIRRHYPSWCWPTSAIYLVNHP